MYSDANKNTTKMILLFSKNKIPKVENLPLGGNPINSPMTAFWLMNSMKTSIQKEREIPLEDELHTCI